MDPVILFVKSLPSIFATAGIVILSVSAMQKTWANLTVRTGFTKIFGLTISDWLVILAESIVIFFCIVLPFPYSNILMSVYFAGLLLVATFLRGTRCNCFGVSRNIIDVVHLGLLAGISTANLAATSITKPNETIASIALGITLGLVILAIWQHERQSGNIEFVVGSHMADRTDYERISEIIIFTQHGCNSCRVLKNILANRRFSVPLSFEDEKHSELVRKKKIASFPSALVRFDNQSEKTQAKLLTGISEIIGFLSRGLV